MGAADDLKQLEFGIAAIGVADEAEAVVHAVGQGVDGGRGVADVPVGPIVHERIHADADGAEIGRAAAPTHRIV